MLLRGIWINWMETATWHRSCSQIKTECCIILLFLATYTNSLFRTGVAPPIHLTKTGFYTYNIQLQSKIQSTQSACTWKPGLMLVIHNFYLNISSVNYLAVILDDVYSWIKNNLWTNNPSMCCQKAHTDLLSCALLWSDWVIWRILKEIVDIVVVDLDVWHEHAVTTVFIDALRFACFIWADHICKFWISSLPKTHTKKTLISTNFQLSSIQ